MNDVTPSRSALLEMRGERQAMRGSLDENRLLLASEMLTGLRAYQRAMTAFTGQLALARQALRAAVARHGLDGLQVWLAAALVQAGVQGASRQLLGVRPIEASLAANPRTPCRGSIHRPRRSVAAACFSNCCAWWRRSRRCPGISSACATNTGAPNGALAPWRKC